jgi:hypothetical protein
MKEHPNRKLNEQSAITFKASLDGHSFIPMVQ